MKVPTTQIHWGAKPPLVTHNQPTHMSIRGQGNTGFHLLRLPDGSRLVVASPMTAAQHAKEYPHPRSTEAIMAIGDTEHITAFQKGKPVLLSTRLHRKMYPHPRSSAEIMALKN